MKTRFTFTQTAVATAVLSLFPIVALHAQQATILGKTATEAAIPAATAQTVAANSATAQTRGEEDNEAAPRNANGGGIKIHGHWLLQVKNPDGKLVDRREFNNSLVTNATCQAVGLNCIYLTGDEILAAILAGDLTPGGLGVTLITATGGALGSPPLSPGSAPFAGAITLDPTLFCPLNNSQAALSQPAQTNCYALVDAKTVLNGWPSGNPNLNSLGTASGGVQTGLTTTVNYAPTVSIVLSGNVLVGTWNPVYVVQTYMAGCGNATNGFGISYTAENTEATSGIYPETRFTGSNQPDLQAGVATNNCTATAQSNPASPVAVVMGILTSTTIPGGPLTVTSGQVITVTVTISFS